MKGKHPTVLHQKRGGVTQVWWSQLSACAPLAALHGLDLINRSPRESFPPLTSHESSSDGQRRRGDIPLAVVVGSDRPCPYCEMVKIISRFFHFAACPTRSGAGMYSPNMNKKKASMINPAPRTGNWNHLPFFNLCCLLARYLQAAVFFLAYQELANRPGYRLRS